MSSLRSTCLTLSIVKSVVQEATRQLDADVVKKHKVEAVSRNKASIKHKSSSNLALLSRKKPVGSSRSRYGS